MAANGGSGSRSLRGRSIATTGCWYVRLCQAVQRADGLAGARSGPFSLLPAKQRGQAIDAVLHLPDEIALSSLREIGPRIGRLRANHALNLLAMEALAAAEHLDADVYLSTPSPQLAAALEAEGRRWRLLTTT